jgi:hypothetical protein
MDHDAVDKRLRKVERLLDAIQPDWRDERNWPKGRRDDREAASINEEAAESDLVVDEEQTRADRIALGYDLPEGDAPSGEAPQADQPAEWTDPDGNVWTQAPAEADVPEKWVTGEGEKHQEFIGSLDELKVLTKPSTE